MSFKGNVTRIAGIHLLLATVALGKFFFVLI